MEIDMTKGSPSKLITRFIIPLIIGNIFQQLYNMVDTVIVGRYVGLDALAAVGATGTIMFLIIGFMQGLTAGFTVVTAQRFGAGDAEGVKKSFVNAIYLSAAITLIATAVSLIFMRDLLTLMNTPEDCFEQSYAYITIICAGLIFNICYNLMASLLRAVGNSKAPLVFLIISAVCNVGLDLLFIISFDMGVEGAALATVISQGFSGILCLIYIIVKVPVLSLRGVSRKPDKKISMKQLGIGFPMALQFSITAIGTIIVQSALNTLGSLTVAAYTAASKIEQIVTQPFVAMGMTMATYGGQNRGINDYSRIHKGVKIGIVMGAIYAVVIGVVVLWVTPYAIPLFTQEDPSTIIEYANTYMKITASFFIPLSVIFVFRNILQSMGYELMPMLGGVVELVSRAIVAVIAADNKSFMGICCANIAAWVSAAVFLAIAYGVLMKKHRDKLCNCVS